LDRTAKHQGVDAVRRAFARINEHLHTFGLFFSILNFWPHPVQTKRF